MKKTLISLTDSQMELLGEEAKKLEISKSELLRRIMYMYLNNEYKITIPELDAEREKKEKDRKEAKKAIKEAEKEAKKKARWKRLGIE